MVSVAQVKDHVKLKQYGDHEALWDRHKAKTDLVSSIYHSYADSERDNKKSERLNKCCGWLRFGWYKNEHNQAEFHLIETSYCHVRSCPICSWRRSLMLKARFSENILKVIDSYPKARFIFLTLTVKNVPVSELRSTLKEMNIAFKRMYQLDALNKYVLGFVRNVEVTRDKSLPDYCHPHFHVLIMVKSTYYKSGYINQSQFTEIWKQSLRASYTPIVDVKSIRETIDKSKIVKEIFKYCVKESDIQADQWYKNVMEQLHHTRSISTSGALKDVVKDISANEDLTHINDSEVLDSLHRIVDFEWNKPKNEYRRK